MKDLGLLEHDTMAWAAAGARVGRFLLVLRCTTSAAADPFHQHPRHSEAHNRSGDHAVSARLHAERHAIAHFNTSELHAELGGEDRLVATRLGTWRPTARCPRPALFLLLYGEYRTFHYTQSNIEGMARRSSGDCYFAVAVTKAALCEPSARMPGTCRDTAWSRNHGIGRHEPLNWSAFAAEPTSVHALMRTASTQTFGGRLAYVVVEPGNRTRQLWGDVQWRVPKYHRLLVALARDVASVHFAPRADDVVVRTRFDVHYTHFFDLAPARRLFRGPRGGYLALGQTGIGSPIASRTRGGSDYHLVTSWAAVQERLVESVSVTQPAPRDIYIGSLSHVHH